MLFGPFRFKLVFLHHDRWLIVCVPSAGLLASFCWLTRQQLRLVCVFSFMFSTNFDLRSGQKVEKAKSLQSTRWSPDTEGYEEIKWCLGETVEWSRRRKERKNNGTIYQPLSHRSSIRWLSETDWKGKKGMRCVFFYPCKTRTRKGSLGEKDPIENAHNLRSLCFLNSCVWKPWMEKTRMVISEQQWYIVANTHFAISCIDDRTMFCWWFMQPVWKCSICDNHYGL